VSPVAAHEFSRIPLLSSLPGERLSELAGRMARESVLPGRTVLSEGEPGERFYVVLEGMLEVTQAGRGQRTLLRPGDYFGEVALAMDIPRTASVRAVTPALVASCNKDTFDEFVRPLFAEDALD
jgi:ATP-binding cassette, subfamily B, bacterial